MKQRQKKKKKKRKAGDRLTSNFDERQQNTAVKTIIPCNIILKQMPNAYIFVLRKAFLLLFTTDSDGLVRYPTPKFGANVS